MEQSTSEEPRSRPASSTNAESCSPKINFPPAPIRAIRTGSRASPACCAKARRTPVSKSLASALDRQVPSIRSAANLARWIFFPIGGGTTRCKTWQSSSECKVALENDADAGALAEAAWGAGQGKSRLIYITVGTGIGGGIILDGELYRGVDGAHPELGHQVIDPSGPPCSCGFRGCWESLAAGPAMAAWAQSQSPANDSYRTAKQICQLAQKGDELARRAAEREAYYLGLGIANLINLFTPTSSCWAAA